MPSNLVAPPKYQSVVAIKGYDQNGHPAPLAIALGCYIEVSTVRTTDSKRDIAVTVLPVPPGYTDEHLDIDADDVIKLDTLPSSIASTVLAHAIIGEARR